uniref:Uncharacterized protein n=1 Tax=Oryza brachyantha TaxID=4533 RepID=J3LW67_ORYBR
MTDRDMKIPEQVQIAAEPIMDILQGLGVKMFDSVRRTQKRFFFDISDVSYSWDHRRRQPIGGEAFGSAQRQSGGRLRLLRQHGGPQAHGMKGNNGRLQWCGIKKAVEEITLSCGDWSTRGLQCGAFCFGVGAAVHSINCE